MRNHIQNHDNPQDFGSSWVKKSRFRNHLGVVIGSYWGRLGVDLGLFLDHLGIIFGSSWGHLVVTFGTLCVFSPCLFLASFLNGCLVFDFNIFFNVLWRPWFSWLLGVLETSLKLVYFHSCSGGGPRSKAPTPIVVIWTVAGSLISSYQYIQS